jgi:hypothetical protein
VVHQLEDGDDDAEQDDCIGAWETPMLVVVVDAVAVEMVVSKEDVASLHLLCRPTRHVFTRRKPFKNVAVK